MTIRLDMLDAAERAARVLGESSRLVARFLQAQIDEGGGFQNRHGESDLYYTVFGVEGLAALGELPAGHAVGRYVRSFGAGAGLGFVDLACLARCWANLAEVDPSSEDRAELLGRLEAHRTADGGYNAVGGDARGTVYGCFLALSAYQDLQVETPDAEGMIRCVKSLVRDDGGVANEEGIGAGSAPATAAAIAVMHELGAQIDEGWGEWLLSRCYDQGGFRATPAAPMPDLLSTATALQGLALMEVSCAEIREGCLDYLDSLWDSAGGFHGTWADEVLDCEYTYYGLLALGHLGEE